MLKNLPYPSSLNKNNYPITSSRCHSPPKVLKSKHLALL